MPFKRLFHNAPFQFKFAWLLLSPPLSGIEGTIITHQVLTASRIIFYAIFFGTVLFDAERSQSLIFGECGCGVKKITLIISGTLILFYIFNYYMVYLAEVTNSKMNVTVGTAAHEFCEAINYQNHYI